METWKDIPGYEGLYQVSDLGKVKTLGRVEEILNRWGTITFRNKPAKEMKLGSEDKSDRPYSTVGLHKDKKVVTFEVHRLVALAFIGPMPAGACTCHKNGDSKDNRADNLRYGTYSENMADKKRHGTNVEGEDISWTSLTNVQVQSMRERYKRGESAFLLAKEYKTDHSNIRRICRGERFVNAGGPLTKRRKK